MRASLAASLALAISGLAVLGVGVVAVGAPAAHTYRIVPGRGKITVNVQTDGLVGENQGPIGPGRYVDPLRPKVLVDGKFPQPHSLQRLPSRLPVNSGPRSPIQGLTLEARDFRGSIVFDPTHPLGSRVELHVPVRSLEPLSPSLEGEDRNEVIDWVRSSWVLDVARAPEISFVGSGVHFRGSAGGGYVNVQMTGRLEIHHRMNPVVLPALAKLTDDGLEVMGRYRVSLRSFDILQLRDRTGAYTMKRDVEVDFHVVAVPETELELKDGEVHLPTLTPRAEHAGELSGKVPEEAELKVPEEAKLRVPEEAELRIPDEAELKGRAWIPDEPSLLPAHDPPKPAPNPGPTASPQAPR